jgi:hypothetical protein
VEGEDGALGCQPPTRTREGEDTQRTVNLDHERFNHVMPDHLKVGMTDPVRDGSPRTGKKVVEDGDLVTKKHESVDEMRTDETGTTGDCGSHEKINQTPSAPHAATSFAPPDSTEDNPPRILFLSAFGNNFTGGNFATVV